MKYVYYFDLAIPFLLLPDFSAAKNNSIVRCFYPFNKPSYYRSTITLSRRWGNPTALRSPIPGPCDCPATGAGFINSNVSLLPILTALHAAKDASAQRYSASLGGGGAQTDSRRQPAKKPFPHRNQPSRLL